MKKIFSLLLMITIIFLAGCGSDYKTELSWALTQNAEFSIENDSYDGDNLKAGTYSFTEDTVRSGKIPIIWDIYVSDSKKNKISELTDEEYRGAVGGIEKEEIEVTLEKGQFVYIVYNKTLGEGTGILQIKKIDK